jgi:dienelactone hydrolase
MKTPMTTVLLAATLWAGWPGGPQALAAPAEDSRQQFLALLERPRVPLAPEVKPIATGAGWEEYHFSYASEAGQRVPGLLFKPAGAQGRLPVVIALHGTGGNKETQLAFIRQMAGRGFIAIAIDGRYAGERSHHGALGTADYQAAIVKAWEGSGEHPFYYDTVWDVMRLLDYLQTREDVDIRRVGLFGISKGGIETYLAAAADPRIAAAVPCVGVQSFAWALEHNSWQARIHTVQSAFDAAARESGSAKDTAMVRRFYDRVVPGIYGPFDGPVMVPLIAPRALLIISSDSDPNNPLPGAQLAFAAARRAYGRLGAEDHLEVKLQMHTGHHVNADSLRQAMDWFTHRLQP